MPRFVQRAPQPADDQPAHHRRIAKAHFGLGGMDIDVDRIGRNVEKQRDHGMPVARHHLGIGSANRADQQPVLHRPTVDEQILMIRHAAVESRQAGDPAKPDPLADEVDPDAIVDQPAIGQHGDAVGERFAAGDAERAPPVMFDRETDVGPRHCEPLDHVETRSELAAGRAQELAARGHALEQSLDAHPRPWRNRGGAFRYDHTVIDHARPALAPAQPALKRHPRDAGDRRQRLAAKAERADVFDRLVGKLRRGVPLERERHVGGRHPTAVVGHFDQVGAPARQPHRYPRSPCIDRVFDQFLQRAGGPFDHFTGSDTIDEMFGQAAY